MASKNPAPETIARANRRRLAQEEGARAIADVEMKATAVRKNMERLRALRIAKEISEEITREAESVQSQSAGSPAKRKRKRTEQ